MKFIFSNFFILFLLFGNLPYLQSNNTKDNMQDDVISICLSTDDNYAEHAGVTIASILKNADPSDKIRIYILHKNLSQDNIDKLSQLTKIRQFELVFKNLQDETVNYLKLNHDDLSMAAWFRLFIPTLCPECKNKILYMDVDIVVLKSLKELWNTNIDDYYAGVVDDFADVDGKDQYRKNVLKLPYPYRYFNSGFILFNMKKCLDENIFEKAIKFAIENSYKLKYEDQDTLNAIMCDKLLYLPVKYNLQNGSPRILFSKDKYLVLQFAYQSTVEAFKDPTIVHYASKNKPWKFFSNHGYKKLYYKYLQFTPWKRDMSFLDTLRYNIVKYVKCLYFNIVDFILNRTLPV